MEEEIDRMEGETERRIVSLRKRAYTVYCRVIIFILCDLVD
jgi:hypothetical protein